MGGRGAIMAAALLLLRLVKQTYTGRQLQLQKFKLPQLRPPWPSLALLYDRSTIYGKKVKQHGPVLLRQRFRLMRGQMLLLHE